MSRRYLNESMGRGASLNWQGVTELGTFAVEARPWNTDVENSSEAKCESSMLRSDALALWRVLSCQRGHKVSQVKDQATDIFNLNILVSHEHTAQARASRRPAAAGFVREQRLFIF